MRRTDAQPPPNIAVKTSSLPFTQAPSLHLLMQCNQILNSIDLRVIRPLDTNSLWMCHNTGSQALVCEGRRPIRYGVWRDLVGAVIEPGREDGKLLTTSWCIILCKTGTPSSGEGKQISEEKVSEKATPPLGVTHRFTEVTDLLSAIGELWKCNRLHACIIWAPHPRWIIIHNQHQ